MIKSMTGYGMAAGVVCGLDITIEVRSVNNRFLDCTIRMPRVYTAFEDSMKAEVQRHISRGKVDVYVTIESTGAEEFEITLNEPLCRAYVNALTAISEKFDVKYDVTAMSLARFPDILNVGKKDADKDELQEGMCRLLGDALDAFDSMRAIEGERLFDDVNSRLDTIETLVTAVEERSPQTVAEYTDRLYKKLCEVLESKNIDESRILTEAAVFADKVAVAEETVRLRSHIGQMREIMNSDEPVGRKADFLIQEMNREANTTGSKCSDTVLAKTVVDMKAELEKIREQIQNVE